jgi:hypothetical protein
VNCLPSSGRKGPRTSCARSYNQAVSFGLTLPAPTTALVLPHVREVSRHACNAEAETIANQSNWSLYPATDSLCGPAANGADYTDCFGGRKLIFWILDKIFSDAFFGAEGY